MEHKVITMGEILLRLSTRGYQRFNQAKKFDINYGGSEANVALALSNFGMKSAIISKIPDNALGQSAINHLRQYGVGTDNIVRGGNRLGLYYLETGASIRPSKVIYDRSGSAVSKANLDEFDFNEIFKDATWFHTSGITPALSDEMAEITCVALKKAKEKGLTTSLDINYRRNLWSKEKANKVLTKLCPYVDVCIGEGVDAILGVKSKDPILKNRKININAYRNMFQRMVDKYEFDFVSSTLRETYDANKHNLSALSYDGDSFYQSESYDLKIVDRIGGGDAFASGLIYGLIKKLTIKETTEFALGASALKHSIPGDSNFVSSQEVKELALKKSGSRLKR